MTLSEADCRTQLYITGLCVLLYSVVIQAREVSVFLVKNVHKHEKFPQTIINNVDMRVKQVEAI